MDEPIDAGRAERFTRLYRRYQPQVLAYARRRMPEPDAGEVVADAFTAAWRHLESAPPDPLPWLYRMASNAAINQWRRNSRWQRLQERIRVRSRPATSPDVATATAGMDALATALARLGDLDREVLRLTAWEGLAGVELAQALGCAEGTAKARLHRARRRLTRLLADTDGTDPTTPANPPMTTEVAR